MKLHEYTKRSNYVLIGSKKGDIYYEMLTEMTAHYPKIKITEVFCKKSPFSIYPPKKYIFFNEKVPPADTIIRCALERSARASPSINPLLRNKFGLVDNQCVVVDDNDVASANRAEKGDSCISGIGSRRDISFYSYERISSPSVLIYEEPFFKGKTLQLDWGEYAVNKELLVQSVDIPERYFVYLVYFPNILRTYHGPTKIDQIYNTWKGHQLQYLTVAYHHKNNVIFCDKENCFTMITAVWGI